MVRPAISPPSGGGISTICSRRTQITAATMIFCLYLLTLPGDSKNVPNVGNESPASDTKPHLRERNSVTSSGEASEAGGYSMQSRRSISESSEKIKDKSAATSDEVITAVHKSDGTVWPSVDKGILKETGRRFPLTPALPAAYDTPPVELRGQITLQTSFGAKLNELASQPDVKLVMEIGTWFGGGSSWCIGQALRQTITNREAPDKWMFTLEMFQPAHDYAASTLINLPVTCVRAGTVGKAGYLKEDEIPAEEKNEHYNLYYKRDIDLADSAPAVLETLCNAYDFDLVLLDGNEYTGFAEFLVVRDVCKPKYLALHDCGTLKTRKVQHYLDGEGSTHWKKLAANVDAAAWAVYQAI